LLSRIRSAAGCVASSPEEDGTVTYYGIVSAVSFEAELRERVIRALRSSWEREGHWPHASVCRTPSTPAAPQPRRCSLKGNRDREMVMRVDDGVAVTADSDSTPLAETGRQRSKTNRRVTL